MLLIADRLWGSMGFQKRARTVIDGGFVSRITPFGAFRMVHCLLDGRAEGQGRQVLVTARDVSLLDSWLKGFLTSQGMMSGEAYIDGPGRVFSCVKDMEQGSRPSIAPDLTRYLKKAYRNEDGFANGPGPVIALAMGRDRNGPDISLWKSDIKGDYWQLAANGVDLSIVDNESIYPGLEFSNLWVQFRTSGSLLASIYCGIDHGVKVGVESLNPIILKHLQRFS